MDKILPIIKKELKKSGGKLLTISKERDAHEIIYKKKKFYLIRTFRIGSGLLVNANITCKDLTAKVLSSRKISNPKTVLVSKFANDNQIRKLIKRFKIPFLIKNAEGSCSIGVYPDIRSEKEALNCIKKARKKFKNILIQEQVAGNEYRVLILGNKSIAVLQMVSPHIIGDGKHTLINLIKKLQKNTELKTNVDNYLLKLLEEQGERINSIPKKNKKIYIRRNSCLAEGGVSIDLTGKINKRMEKICVDAARAVGLQLAGIDIFCKDISKKPSEQRYWIVDINGKPDLYIHHFPMQGKSRNVVKKILDYIVSKNL